MFSRVLMFLVLFSAVSYGSDQKRPDDFKDNLVRAFASKKGLFAKSDAKSKKSESFSCSVSDFFALEESLTNKISIVFNKYGLVIFKKNRD